MTYAVSEPETIAIAMPDGARLVADVYRPVGAGRVPVLLMRQPYGRKIASTVVLAHPVWYAAHGYIVMVQDVRGRGDSEGEFRLLVDDAADGAATLAAAADLAGCDGRVATYGFSYQGITQYLAFAGARAARTIEPAAMAVVMAPWDIRNHWAYEGGAFRLQGGQMWAVQMAAENARLAGDTAAHHALRSALGRLCGGFHPARLDVLDAYPQYSHYADWLADDPTYWAARSPSALLAGQRLELPTFHVGGWLDIMLDGTFAAYQAFRAGGQPSRLKVGPWPHLPWGRRAGGPDMGAAAGAGIDIDIVGFFDHVLKGAEPTAAVELFDLGTRRFVAFDRLPEGREASLFLASNGRAAPTVTDGELVPEPGGAGTDRLVSDPWRPAPGFGLTLGTPGGYVDRAAVDDRGDVAVYTGAPLAADLTISGPIRAEIHVTSDRPSFDLAATLSVVADDGSAMALAGGFTRVPAGATAGPVVVDLNRTMMTVAAGKRLRLSLAAAAWPAFMLNPGTGVRPEEATFADAQVTTLAIRHGAGAPSRLVFACLE
ncbi:MAG: CocE/NonD family hydrolase [Ancalomicrobiaceae bacterium]|nr:CocE/NonD family hydrolase [Ancalomicrobiaceae bacterium]